MKDRMKEKLENPLVLVIDMQNVYAKGGKWECGNFERALEKITRLLRASKGAAIFTRYIAAQDPTGVWKEYNAEYADVNEDSWSNELDAGLSAEFASVPCCDKSVYSACSIPEVREAADKASCVVITGVVAECCVLSTVMGLIDAGKYVFYLSDAVAGINDETEAATIKVLEGLAPLHVQIMTTDEFMRFAELE